jgi:hypothetical protein
MVPASKTVPDIPAFPVNGLSAPKLGAVPQAYYMLITHSVFFDITLGVCQHHHNVGSRHLPVVHVRVTPDRGFIFFFCFCGQILFF